MVNLEIISEDDGSSKNLSFPSSGTFYELASAIQDVGITLPETFFLITNSQKLNTNESYTFEDGQKVKIRDAQSLECFGANFTDLTVGKIKLIFDLFKNEENKFVKSDELNTYLISSFLICSYCMISARKKITNTNPAIKAMTKEDLLKCLRVSELKDSQNLLKVFNESFFDKDELTWEEFRAKFEKNEGGFQWLLSPKGIRKKLEENDV